MNQEIKNVLFSWEREEKEGTYLSLHQKEEDAADDIRKRKANHFLSEKRKRETASLFARRGVSPGKKTGHYFSMSTRKERKRVSPSNRRKST